MLMGIYLPVTMYEYAHGYHIWNNFSTTRYRNQCFRCPVNYFLFSKSFVPVASV